MHKCRYSLKLVRFRCKFIMRLHKYTPPNGVDADDKHEILHVRVVIIFSGKCGIGVQIVLAKLFSNSNSMSISSVKTYGENPKCASSGEFRAENGRSYQLSIGIVSIEIQFRSQHKFIYYFCVHWPMAYAFEIAISVRITVWTDQKHRQKKLTRFVSHVSTNVWEMRFVSVYCNISDIASQIHRPHTRQIKAKENFFFLITKQWTRVVGRLLRKLKFCNRHSPHAHTSTDST